MSETPMPIEIFCSYAHADEVWRDKLERHMSVLRRQGLISFWHDRRIIPGTNWAKSVDTHLNTASIVLLLVSASFFASDYCVGIEMTRALERQEAGEVHIVPIVVRPVDWSRTPLAHLQGLPTDAKPLSTWQDEESGLVDVTVGLRRLIEDLPVRTASAPRAAFPPIWNIPYPRNPFFLGRDYELDQMHQQLYAGQAIALSQPQAISGLGGIGKTQLVLEYAYRYSQDYQAILWAQAESIEALISSYVALAKLLRLPECEAKEQEVTVQAVKIWLQTHSGWLLVLDNADELMLLSGFLPPSLGGHLLLTTRAAATGRLAQRLEIKTLLREQAALLLLRRAALLAPDASLEQVSQEEWRRALQISEELGGLPLALDQAGAYLEETGIDLTGYQHLYRQHRTDILQQRRGLVADHPLPVATTWSLSFQRVKDRNLAAAELLHLCVYFSPDAIPEEILTTDAPFLGPVLSLVTADPLLLNQAIEVLRAYSLVRRDPKEKTLSIHRLVQAVFQDALEETEKHQWAERAMLLINLIFPDAELGAWRQCERLLPQALAAAQAIKRYQIMREEAGHLLQKTASYLQARARYAEAEQLYQDARHVFEQHLGPEHPQIASVLNGLANLYYEDGRYTEAEQLYQDARRIFEQHLGPEHPNAVSSLNGLANIYRQQGKYVEAEALYQRALQIWEQHLGPEHPQVASPLIGLANVYRQQGRYAEAEALYQRALQIWDQYLRPEHLQVASPLHNLAILSRHQGKYAEAETLYLQAVRIWEHYLGSEHPQVAYPLTGLAILYHEQGKYAEAEQLFLHVQQYLRPEHLQIAYPLTGLADIYREQGKYMEAGSLYLRALHIREQTRGLHHPDTVELIYNLAHLREVQDNGEEACMWYARALAIREQVLGVQHPKTMETRTRFAALLSVMGLHKEAAQLEVASSEQ